MRRFDIGFLLTRTMVKTVFVFVINAPVSPVMVLVRAYDNRLAAMWSLLRRSLTSKAKQRLTGYKFPEIKSEDCDQVADIQL